ncbi:MAG TPA: hypothetical protein VIN08_18740 [Ohtaekwangia sp.]|uniref:hypothetical protein n=1 Tax=Ohtaekwangia sp. TaxID=2066019 RepID=UPI002F91ECDD
MNGNYHSEFWDGGGGSGNSGGNVGNRSDGSISYTSLDGIAAVLNAIIRGATGNEIYNAAMQASETGGLSYFTIAKPSSVEGGESINNGEFAFVSAPDEQAQQGATCCGNDTKIHNNYKS